MFHTVAEIDYASDLEAIHAETGYKGLVKDQGMYGKKISLLLNGEEKVYEKGIGAHANSKIEYQLDGKYDLFEAFIGIDGEMRDSEHSSVTFQVLVDDVVKNESGLVTAKTEQEHVKLDIKGASKITLITNSKGVVTADHSVWADAKFARINSEKTEADAKPAKIDSEKIEIQILNELKSALIDALQGIDVTEIELVSMSQPSMGYVGSNDTEKLVADKLQKALEGKYDGKFSIYVSNYLKEDGSKDDTVEELIQNGVYIKYKKKDSGVSYLMNEGVISELNQ